MRHLLHQRLVTAALLAALVTMVGYTGVAVAGQSSGDAGESRVQAKKKEKSVRGKRGKRGKRGTRGPAGPAGAPGPQGAPGPAGVSVPLIFKAQSPTPSTPIYESSGLLINASCNPITELTGVSEVSGSIVRATDVVSGSIFKTNSTVVNEKFTLTPGGAENNYVLTYLAGNGSSIITANYGLANGGMSLVNVACAVFGTISTAAG
jgi:hypothetical protein